MTAMRPDAINVVELKRIQERWLKLRDEFPRIWHLSAVQTGPVLIEGEWWHEGPGLRLDKGSDRWIEREILGSIKTSVLGVGLPGEPMETFEHSSPDVVLPKRANDKFCLSLWGDLFDSAITAGTSPMRLGFLTSPERMAMHDAAPDWFGRCNFAEGWGISKRSTHILPEAFQDVARDSTTFAGRLLRHPQLRVSAFNRWLSHVYEIIGFPDQEPQHVEILLTDLHHRLYHNSTAENSNDVLLIGTDEQFIPMGLTLDLYAKIPLRGVYLPSDVCTASVMAIQSLLDSTATAALADEGQNKPVEFVFRPSGNGYEIMAFREHGHATSLKGLPAICRLLESPNKPVPMALLGAGAATLSDTKHLAADNETIKAAKKRMKELSSEIGVTKSSMDREKLQSEFKKIEAYCRSATGKGGKARDLNQAEIDKLRVVIRRQINRVIKAIDESMPQTAVHLDSSISAIGSNYIYKPDNNSIEWLTEKI